MRTFMAVGLVATAAVLGAPAIAQQVNQSARTEADKGIKTENSGASGFLQDQEKAGAAAHAPGQPETKVNPTGTASGATSAQNSGAGISGAPGNKNGPPAKQGTVGANPSTQQQDPAHVQQTYFAILPIVSLPDGAIRDDPDTACVFDDVEEAISPARWLVGGGGWIGAVVFRQEYRPAL
jgi:hypothetical protein